MITNDDKDFDWEAWSAMLKKAHTNEEYSAVAQALPNLRKPLEQ